jgi:hypothetical protein
MLTGHSGGLKPEFLRQAGVFAVPAAPLIKLEAGSGQDAGKCCLLSGVHQLVLLEKGFASPPGDPSREPPIKRNLPATTDDTSGNESFHAPLPKAHPQIGPFV